MEIVLVLIVVCILFVLLGILGWVLKALGVVLDFLWEGCTTNFGCLVWVFLVVLILVGLGV